MLSLVKRSYTPIVRYNTSFCSCILITRPSISLFSVQHVLLIYSMFVIEIELDYQLCDIIVQLLFLTDEI